MNVLAVSPALQELSGLIVIIARLLPDAEIFASLGSDDALSLTRTHGFSIAFIDAGLNIAEQFHTLSPDTRIITTPKPLTVESISRELEHNRRRLFVQTFGGFSIFVDRKPLNFRRTKAKELFAILVDRRGCSVTTREACAILFEDQSYTETQGSYYRTLVSELTWTFRRNGLEGVIRKSRNSISADISKFECDAYRFLKGDPEMISMYNGDYMVCYSWAEYSSGMFDRKIRYHDDKLWAAVKDYVLGGESICGRQRL